MRRSAIFELIARSLSPCLRLGVERVPDGDLPWSEIVEASSVHMVSAALGFAFAHDPGVPAQAADYFGAVLELNRARNQALQDCLDRAVGALNGVGIRPLLLKGAGLLAERAYPDQGIRMLGDLDLLVDEGELDRAWACLNRAGFEPVGKPAPAKHHHLTMLIERATGVGIELHRHPLMAGMQPLMPLEGVFRKSVPIALGRAAARLPCDRQSGAQYRSCATCRRSLPPGNPAPAPVARSCGADPPQSDVDRLGGVA
jgi:Uncharacterised nucleotidyltransferase